MGTGEIITLAIVFGFIFCVMLPIILYHILKPKRLQKYETKWNKARMVLCLPSGEIIKIKDSKWDKLCKRNEVQWIPNLDYYCIKDKYSKYKVNEKRNRSL